MERLFSIAEGLVGPCLTSARDEERECMWFNFCASASHGDIFCSRSDSNIIKAKLGDQGLTLDHLLSPQGIDDDQRYFSSLSVNPQGQLCLTLNRPLVIAMTIDEVINQGAAYGCRNVSSAAETSLIPSTTDKQQILLVHQFSSSLRESVDLQGIAVTQLDQVNCKMKEATLVVDTMPLNKLDLNEGRSLLVLGLLLRLLQAQGHSVTYCANLAQEMSVDDPSYQVWHLLRTMLPVEFQVQTSSHSTRKEFVDTIGRLPQHTERSGGVLHINAQSLTKEVGVSGSGGYDRNLEKIQVTNTTGGLSIAARNAQDVVSNCRLPVGGASHMTLYVAGQQASFAVQQCMLICEAYYIATKQHHHNQHILLTSAVNCRTKNGETTNCTFSELLETRLHQMTEAYVVKHGERTARGTQLQSMALRMAEAVVKFELLSSNPSSNVKLELPKLIRKDQSEQAGCGSQPDVRDLRFDGSFVMYNYARIATILSHFEQECTKGTYPHLPKLSIIDFSLLKEEEEWKLVFQFVLQYPMIVKEAAKLRKKGVGVHIDMSLKKVCQFLTKLSHTFSSYYSRVKVLMPPEPHLFPLIHARLYLILAIKQVMDNALALLAIEPLEQL